MTRGYSVCWREKGKMCVNIVCTVYERYRRGDEESLVRTDYITVPKATEITDFVLLLNSRRIYSGYIYSISPCFQLSNVNKLNVLWVQDRCTFTLRAHCALSKTDTEPLGHTVQDRGHAALEGDIQLLLWQSAQRWKTHHGNGTTDQESRLGPANLASCKEWVFLLIWKSASFGVWDFALKSLLRSGLWQEI